jgi:polysaccharide biosynthesis/export protein
MVLSGPFSNGTDGAKACSIIITNSKSMNSHRPYFLLITVVMTVLVASCITSKKLAYLQHEGMAADTVKTFQTEDYKIQPFDNLYIKVVTPDPQWSDMFNTAKTSESSGNLTEQSADLISYSVDKNGRIDIPFVGKFDVAGKSVTMIKNELVVLLKAYVTDASVTVKMINNYVSVLGEVKLPGKYPIYKERMNIFQALAMAGDLGEYSDRSKVQIIRQVDSTTVVKEFSLTDRSILTSEFFYVMPNDVIYSVPMKGRFFQMNAFPYGVVLSIITTFILFLNVLQ